MTHLAHRMHDNSLQTFREEEGRLSKRAQMILEWIREHGARTDRQVMRGMRFREPGEVRPRISELVKTGKLVEIDEVCCPITGKTVRRVDVPRPKQEALFP